MRPRILFVDDEPKVLEGIRRLLHHRRGEWELFFAQGANQALELMDRSDVDAVVTDIMMPERDGFDLLATIRSSERHRDVPVVILTGKHEQGLKGRALELGATDLLQKPVEIDDLTARLRSVLRIKAYQDAIRRQNEVLEQRVRERTADLEYARVDLIWRLGKAGEYRDEETGNHVVRVGHYCRVLAEGLGQDREFVDRIFLTSPLHDVGKIGIPDAILLKFDRLTPAEWAVMQTHTTIGGEILNPMGTFQKFAPRSDDQALCSRQGSVSIPELQMAASIARSHHERWDGAGYPRGLAGPDIPLEGRIVALADVYDALLSPRPYKRAFPEDETLDIMQREQGTRFDPEIFDVFLKSLDAFRDIRHRFRDE